MGCKPFMGHIVLNMHGVDERNQQVYIEQEGHYGNSSRN